MDTLNRETILELINYDAPIAVSITMTLSDGEGRQGRQDHLQLKSLLERAEDELRTLDMPMRQIDDMLESLRDEVEHSNLSKRDGQSLAAFLAPGFQRLFFLPGELPESAIVDTRFHLRSLVPALSRGARYYILDLSENHNRLILAEGGQAQEIDFAAPQSLNASMHLEDREFEQQMHSSGSAQSGMEAAAFHGGGSWNDYEKAQIPLYCKQIDKVVNAMLSADRAPLVLVAEQRMAAFYQQSNSYRYLVDKPILGNHRGENAHDLARAAWPLAEPHLPHGAADKRQQMEEVANTEKGLVDPAQIIGAALEGRIDTLFFDPQAELWGIVDPSTQAVSVQKSRADKNDDLLELALRETLRHGGLALASAPGQLPSGASMAALLRWPGGTSRNRM